MKSIFHSIIAIAVMLLFLKVYVYVSTELQPVLLYKKTSSSQENFMNHNFIKYTNHVTSDSLNNDQNSKSKWMIEKKKTARG